MPVAYHLDRTAGQNVRLAGGNARVLAAAEHTGGAVAVVEGLLPVGSKLASHTHDAEDLSLYVLEGELQVECGKSSWTISAGGFALLPRGVPHAVRASGWRAARVVWTVWRPGVEHVLVDGGPTSAAAGCGNDVCHLSAVLVRHGVCQPPAR